MKIVFFIGGLSGGGAERVCCGLANFLFQRGHEVEFLTIADDQVTYPLAEGIGRTVLLAHHERKNFLYIPLYISVGHAGSFDIPNVIVTWLCCP